MNRDVLYLWDIVKCCDRVAEYIQEGREAFMADTRTQDAVIRNIEIIGEASKQLSVEVKTSVDQPWRQIGGMRDKLIHQYFGVQLDRVWQTASTILPPFRASMAKLLGELEERPATHPIPIDDPNPE